MCCRSRQESLSAKPMANPPSRRHRACRRDGDREAKVKGIPAADHAAHLVVHGMLHLLGFDHERDADAERMEALETKVLAGLGIADPYAGDALPVAAEVMREQRSALDDELPATGDPLPEEEPSWLERLLARFGLGEEPDLREVIEDALARGKEAGGDTFSAQERAMLRNILRFGKLTVEDVMVPRADIIAVEDTITIAELLRVFREAEHSRLPVYNETLDDPRGMIHIRDLMSWITTAAEKNATTLDLAAVDLGKTVGAINIVREILYVPPSMPVLDLLLRMQSSRLHLALVVDEYGGTDGLVSIEDLIEEVVGEIDDEHDGRGAADPRGCATWLHRRCAHADRDARAALRH